MHNPGTARHRRHLPRAPFVLAILVATTLLSASLLAVLTLHGGSRAAAANASGPCGDALALRTSAGIVCAHGDDSAFVADVSSSDSISRLAIPCHGDGTSGDRIAFYYAYVAGHANRVGSVRGRLRSAIEQANEIVYQSARQTGGKRWLRVATDSKCRPTIRTIKLPKAAVSSFGATIEAAQAAGLNAANRKYVLFVDSDALCGIATLRFDDRPGQENVNNAGPSWARVDRGCWTGAPTAHEIFHMLGAVQQSAPHYDGTGHCTDDHDIMCYQSAGGKKVYIRCRSLFKDDRLDCGKDDYFNASPRAGSYLARHWDTARSAFLYDGGSAPLPLPGGVTTPGVSMLTSTTARVHWSAPAGSQVSSYDVMKDGTTVWHGTSTHWDDAAAIAGIGQYQVRAVNKSGAGPWSSPIDATLTAPPAPQSVTATSSTSVAWTADSSLADGFLFYGISADGTAHYLSSLPAGARAATDYTWSLFRSWNRYRVCSYNAAGTACRDEAAG